MRWLTFYTISVLVWIGSIGFGVRAQGASSWTLDAAKTATTTIKSDMDIVRTANCNPFILEKMALKIDNAGNATGEIDTKIDADCPVYNRLGLNDYNNIIIISGNVNPDPNNLVLDTGTAALAAQIHDWNPQAGSLHCTVNFYRTFANKQLRTFYFKEVVPVTLKPSTP